MYDDRNFKGRGTRENKNNNRNYQEKTIVEKGPIILDDDNYVEQAEKVILSLIKKNGKDGILTTSQIRKLLSMLSDMYTKVKHTRSDKLDREALIRIQYFKLHTIYEAGRENGEKSTPVKDFIEEAQLIKQIDNIKSDKNKLILFYHYMEALVAYRKYHGGRDE